MSPARAPALLVLLCTSALATGAEPRRDFYDDPLPEGAVARLGSVRFRPGGWVSHLVFSPDGKRLASWSESGLSVWDSRTGRELRRVELSFELFAIAWPRPDLGVAVVDAGGGTPAAWNFADEAAPPPDAAPVVARPVRVADEEWSWGAAISPDGRHFAAGRAGHTRRDRPIDLWEVAPDIGKRGLKHVREFGPQPGECDALEFSPDGKTLFALSRVNNGSDNRVLWAWDVGSGKQLQSWAAPPASTYQGGTVLAVSPGGESVALAATDGTARILPWSADSKPRLLAPTGSKAKQYHAVTDAAFSPDGRFFATSGPAANNEDYVLRLWDARDWRELRAISPCPARVGPVTFAPDGERVAADWGGVIRVWDTGTGTEQAVPQGHTSAVRHATVVDRQTVVTSEDGKSRVWDLETGRPRFLLDGTSSGRLARAPDARTLVDVWPAEARGWDARSGQRVPLAGGLAQARGGRPGFSADGKTLMISDYGAVLLWDWPAGRLRRRLEPAGNRDDPFYSQASLSPDGRLVAVTTRGRRDLPSAIDVFDSGSGARLVRLGERALGGPAEHIFLPDGRSLVVLGFSYRGGEQGRIPMMRLGVWDALTGRLKREFGQPVNPGITYGMALSPDGRSLAVLNWLRGVYLFEVATGQVRSEFGRHRSAVTSISFSPDGRRLVTTSEDHTGLVWDVTLSGAAARVKPPAAGEWGGLWTTLSAGPAPAAYGAMARLGADPAGAVAFLRERLRPAAKLDRPALDRLFAGLDADSFAARQRAAAELGRLGRAAVGPARERLKQADSAEARERLQRFLDAQAQAAPTPEELRQGRAVELLEGIASPEARALLGELAGGEPAAPLTRDAAESLRRLEK